MKKLPVLLIGLVLVLALAAVAGGCGTASPKDTVDKAIQNSQDVKSQHIDFDVNLSVNGDLSAVDPDLEGINDIRLVARGGADVDNTVADSPKARGNLALEGLDEIFASMAQSAGEDEETQMGLDLISGFLSDIEFVVLDQKAYVKLAGTWYDLGDASDAADMGGGFGFSLGDSSENAQCYQDAMKDPNRFGSDQLFSNLQEAGEENIDGTGTHRYTANVDLEKALTAFSEIARSCGDAETAGGLEGAGSEITSLFRSFTVEMWIDGDDNLRQIRIQIDLDPGVISDTAESMSGITGDDVNVEALESITLDATIKMSRFNETFDITAPEGDIMKIEDLLGSFGGLGGLEGLEDLEDLEGLDGTSTTPTGTGTTSSYSR